MLQAKQRCLRVERLDNVRIDCRYAQVIAKLALAAKAIGSELLSQPVVFELDHTGHVFLLALLCNVVHRILQLDRRSIVDCHLEWYPKLFAPSSHAGKVPQVRHPTTIRRNSPMDGVG